MAIFVGTQNDTLNICKDSFVKWSLKEKDLSSLYVHIHASRIQIHTGVEIVNGENIFNSLSWWEFDNKYKYNVLYHLEDRLSSNPSP